MCGCRSLPPSGTHFRPADTTTLRVGRLMLNNHRARPPPSYEWTLHPGATDYGDNHPHWEFFLACHIYRVTSIIHVRDGCEAVMIIMMLVMMMTLRMTMMPLGQRHGLPYPSQSIMPLGQRLGIHSKETEVPAESFARTRIRISGPLPKLPREPLYLELVTSSAAALHGTSLVRGLLPLAEGCSDTRNSKHHNMANKRSTSRTPPSSLEGIAPRTKSHK